MQVDHQFLDPPVVHVRDPKNAGETRGAPYPPAPPSERNPNPDDGEWLPVPDGPPVGDLQPANEQIGIKEVEVDKDDDDKKTQR